MKIIKYLVIFFTAIQFNSLFAYNSGSEIQPDNLFPRVKLVTQFGDIIVELDRHKAPITSNNFLVYVTQKQYDNTVFHRVIADFVVQGGGYDLLYNPIKENQPIFNESGNGLKNESYTIAMARSDKPHSATSQFYFNISDNPGLDPGSNWGYSVFGVVIEGTEILDRMSRVQTGVDSKLGWPDVPVKPLVLVKAMLLEE
ncbi:peptidylprolyl isomerase [Aliikangiella sp. IMCC44653]